MRIVRDKDTGAGTAEVFDNTTYDWNLKVFPNAGQIAHEYRWNPSFTREGDAPEIGLELLFSHVLRVTMPTLGGASYFTIPVVHRQRREQALLCPSDPLAIEAYVRAIAEQGAPRS
jgi:hypothetical protein